MAQWPPATPSLGSTWVGTVHMSAKPAAATRGLVGRDHAKNPIWVRDDGPYGDLPGLTPAPFLEPAVQPPTAADPSQSQSQRATGAGSADPASAGPTEELDPFDEDEALAAAAEEEAAAEAAEVPAARPVGLVGHDHAKNPIWVRGEGPYGDLRGLTPAPFVEPALGPSHILGDGDEEADAVGEDDDAEDGNDEEEEDEAAAADSDRGRGSERFAKEEQGRGQGERSGGRGQESSNSWRGQGQRGGARSSAPAVATTSVWVGKLPVGITMQVLHDAFKHFGDIIGVNLQPRQPGDTADSCGVVNFANPAAARAALQMMQGAEVGGSNVQVRAVADPSSSSSGGSNRRGGGGGGGNANAGERRIPVAGDGDNWECPSCDNVNCALATLTITISLYMLV